MHYNDMTETEKMEMDEWMEEMDAAYLEECYIEERAQEENERNFDYYQW